MAKAVVGVAATALDFKVSGAGGKPKKSMATMRRGRLKLTHAPQRESADAIMGRRVAKQRTGPAPMDADKDATGRSRFLRYATRRRGFLVASLLVGFVVGVAYRAFLDEANSRSVANYLRSGFDGLCMSYAGKSVTA